MELWWASRVEQNKRHVSTRKIRGKSLLRTRSNYRESECNKPRRATSPALSIYILSSIVIIFSLPDAASSVPFD
jgi:hypothetical protein